ncbi:MAG: ATP-dependent Clp protease adapter ClpS [Actinomycetes bacterium]
MGAAAATAQRAAGALPTPVREEMTDVLSDVRPDRPWDVIVWDDPVNLMSYVVFVFRKVLGHDEPVARKLMLEVHTRGKALVASEPREQAEMYVQQLHEHGLHATMQRAS